MLRLPRRLALLIAAAMLAACATTPAPSPAPLSAPLVTSSGLVIGTLSYQYVDVAERPGDPQWVIHFDRIDAPSTQDYALAVEVDRATRSGVFTGALPAGVYAFREAASADRRFPSGAMRLPFEVQAGEVHDAGHYALNPLAQ